MMNIEIIPVGTDKEMIKADGEVVVKAAPKGKWTYIAKVVKSRYSKMFKEDIVTTEYTKHNTEESAHKSAGNSCTGGAKNVVSREVVKIQ